jgi:transcriptional accessory protein Tex/SPT6
MEEELAPLFEGDEAKKFRSRWLAIQSKFVDDPNDSVKQADDLVSDVIKSVTMNFSNRRIALEKQWNAEENTSTEDLRMAIKRYRSFFDRLLTLES